MKLTKHGDQRCSERLGAAADCHKKAAHMAFRDGLKPEEARGCLRNYLEWVLRRVDGEDRAVRLYGGYVFIYGGGKLVTVYLLPVEHRREGEAQERMGRTGRRATSSAPTGHLPLKGKAWQAGQRGARFGVVRMARYGRPGNVG